MRTDSFLFSHSFDKLVQQTHGHAILIRQMLQKRRRKKIKYKKKTYLAQGRLAWL
jgi:hypothetical protein